MCPCLVPISSPVTGMLKEYKYISLPNGKSSFEVSGVAYAPAAQALSVGPDGLDAAQAARRQNMV